MHSVSPPDADSTLVKVGGPGATVVAIHPDFETAGTAHALRRMHNALFDRCGLLCTALVEPLISVPIPSWVTSRTLIEEVVPLINSAKDIHVLIRAMRVIRVRVDNMSERVRLTPESPDDIWGIYDDAMDVTTKYRLAAAAKLVYGELMEAVARFRALQITSEQEVPSPTVRANAASRSALARIYYDSYLIAVWTSAHAEYVATLDDALAKMPPACTAESVFPPEPSPSSVGWAVTSLPDLHTLVDRRIQSNSHGPGSKAAAALSKQSIAMNTVLTRCTNAGSRGWDSTLADAIKDGEGCHRVCHMAMVSAMCGMNALIHPASRPSWEMRQRIHRTILATIEAKRLLCDGYSASKEAMRCYLAHILTNLPATREAMHTASHPAGSLIASPFELAPVSMQAAMKHLVTAGVHVGRSGTSMNVIEMLQTSFSEDQRRNKNRGNSASDGSNAFTPSQNHNAIAYTPSWLGRSQPLSTRGPTLVSTANALFFDVFRSAFVPLWHEFHRRGHRLSRLDTAQFKTLVATNPLRMLLETLDDDRRLQVIRSAILDHAAELRTPRQVAERLGITMPPPSTRGVIDLLECEPESAAAVLLYAQVAAQRNHILAYDLGSKTRAMQIRALARRLMIPNASTLSEEEILKQLPPATHKLFLCVECKRVANAVQANVGKVCPFNELGLASAMLRVDGEVKDGHMRCAKRSSAALRTAITLECEAAAHMRGDSTALTSTAMVVYDHASMTTKLRRDTKSSFEQTGPATACGDQPMVTVPLLGKVVKVYGQFYALCSICACVCIVKSDNRFKGEICCLRCDAVMLTRDRPEEAEKAVSLPTEATRVCRFCGKPDTSTLANTKWKCIVSPLDNIGPNASVPPPLRTVYYCPSHYKGWLPAAHRELTTPVVFAHITQRAKPVSGAQNHGKGARMITVNDTDEFSDPQASGVSCRPLAICDSSQPAKKKARRVRQLKRKTTVS